VIKQVIIYIIIVPLGFFNLKAQNLVLNGSFEEYYQLPSAIGQINYCKYWNSPNNNTPDYFHNDATYMGVNIPLNAWGYQNAYEGNAYAGIFIYNMLYPEGVDYVQSKLIFQLLSKRYCVSFYVSLADSASVYAVNNIGVYFSQDSVFFNNNNRLSQFSPQIINNSINSIADHNSWIKISGNFLAIGGEKYIMIGNFNLPENDDTIQVQGYSNSWASAKSGYIYIDSVSVTLCDDVGIEEKPLDKIDIYSNPTQDFVSIGLPKSYTQANLSIYNLTGQLISQKQLTQTNQQIPIIELSDGMYIFVIQNGGKVIGRQRVIVAR
jgi:OOP family OmpA-OmpF porin